jgi:hypothetical protein
MAGEFSARASCSRKLLLYRQLPKSNYFLFQLFLLIKLFFLKEKFGYIVRYNAYHYS